MWLLYSGRWSGLCSEQSCQMAQVPPPPLPVIVTRIEPNDGLINANDAWVRESATDTASNGIVATLAGKHSNGRKKKGLCVLWN